MIHLNDTIKKLINETQYVTLYRASCDTCGIDRGYMPKQNAQRSSLCRICSHKNISEETRQRLSTSSKGRTAWNKGKSGVSSETRRAMSKRKKGLSPPNKGEKMSLEQRVKLSCASRGIDVPDFDDFTTGENSRLRNAFIDQRLHVVCFDRDKYTCTICGISKVLLHAHHKNSWKHFPDQRFVVDNLASVCYTCHREFHKIYGNGKKTANTEEQWIEFKNTKNTTRVRKKIILVTGVSGSGKSWVCQQLKDLIFYYEYDKNPRGEVRSKIWNLRHEKILYDPFSHVSTFISRNSDIFDVELYVIVESESVIKQRIEARGGLLTPFLKKRINRMKHLAARHAVFSGTSQEVLEELKRRLG